MRIIEYIDIRLEGCKISKFTFMMESFMMNNSQTYFVFTKVISIMNTHLNYAHSKSGSLNHKTNYLLARLSKKLNFK